MSAKPEKDPDDAWDPTGYYRRQEKKHAAETGLLCWLAAFTLIWGVALAVVHYCDAAWSWIVSLF